MNTERKENRERNYYWEWFRHAQWINSQELTEEKKFVSCLSKILNESNVNSCLHYLCGFGFICNLLNQKNQKVYGYDISESAIKGANIYTSTLGYDTIFFNNNKAKPLSESIPHKMNAVFSTELLFEQNWHELKRDFSEIYDVISPGGFLIFSGPTEHTAFANKEIAEFDLSQDESIEWSYRDGNKQCTKLKIKSNSEVDYRDYRNLFIISTQNSIPELEVIQERIPGYWNFHNICDLVLETGFSHFEARSFKQNGYDIALNVAYKDGELPQNNRSYSEEQIYKDF